MTEYVCPRCFGISVQTEPGQHGYRQKIYCADCNLPIAYK